MRTRVGYAGGTKPNPTYYDLGDHTETIEIDYDPSQVSYEDLLDVFWSSHDPTARPFSRQYMSMIFYHSEEQKRLAMETRDRETASRGREIHTEIVPAEGFTLAEDYHQKYRLQAQREIMAEFTSIYPAGGWIGSTAAARVNGYLGGHGDLSQLQEKPDVFGLSSSAIDRLVAMASRLQR